MHSAGLPRHINGLYSGLPSGTVAAGSRRDLARQRLTPRARELMMRFESLTIDEDVTTNWEKWFISQLREMVHQHLHLEQISAPR